MQHDLYDIAPLTSWHHKNIALIGDAAHAMTPNMGQGAAQSIEDAWAVSHALKTCSSVEVAFTAYEKTRFKKANQIAKLSWQIGQISNWQNPILCSLRNNAMMLSPKRLAEKQQDQLYSVPSYACGSGSSLSIGL